MATATRRNKKKDSTLVKWNQVALDTTHELVDGAITTGEKWQKLYAKTLKQSQPLVEKNVDLAFDAVETLISQYQSGVKRVRHLFSADTKKVKRTVKKVAAQSAPVRTTVAKKVSKARSTTTTARTKVNKYKASDLKLLPGIGPKMEELLKANGYKTINAISKAKVADLKAVLDKADRRYRLLKPNSWITAAKKMVK